MEIRRRRLVEKPTLPLPPGQYLVTGDRDVTTALTIQPKDKSSNQRWELANGATLYDFPVNPGAAIPAGGRRSRDL